MEDEEIVELYLKRNEEAIRYTSEKYGTKLRHISFRITGDAHTLLNLLQKWNSVFRARMMQIGELKAKKLEESSVHFCVNCRKKRDSCLCNDIFFWIRFLQLRNVLDIVKAK